MQIDRQNRQIISAHSGVKKQHPSYMDFARRPSHGTLFGSQFSRIRQTQKQAQNDVVFCIPKAARCAVFRPAIRSISAQSVKEHIPALPVAGSCYPGAIFSGWFLAFGRQNEAEKEEGKIKRPATSGDEARSRLVFLCAGRVGRVQGFRFWRSFLLL
ncbi:hypothetical protein K2X14_08970 [Acetobacter sp. TBRC 12305]|uniref:Uncharacterized protein n=1 Tax=Acetobacter garciniae TaxID=2817435 RepID=A0A939HPR3_9PROT|nr:hypothetical protein [Acetobacter garciniae]MBO1325066.1 hypothetical protein [Acetobacter garciniae]MBX0344963.1 hypothetical protein [Acetobacter garciniae]